MPILQAPIGSAAGANLCAAVSNAGGIGSVSLTWRDESEAEILLTKIRSLTNKNFSVNFVLHFEPKCLSTALDAGVPILTFSWGDATRYVNDVRSTGALLGLQVTNAGSTRSALDHCPDFLIAQGMEAGGHVQGHMPLNEALTEVLAKAGSVPVFASGGLATGADLAKAMRLGAAGGVFGTRFLATEESEAHPQYRGKLVESQAKDTVLTTCFDGGWPYAMHRVLRNSTFDRWESAGCPAPGMRPREGEWVAATSTGEPIYRYDDAMPRIDTTGNCEAMALYAGKSVDGVRGILPAAEIVKQLWAEAQIDTKA